MTTGDPVTPGTRNFILGMAAFVPYRESVEPRHRTRRKKRKIRRKTTRPKRRTMKL